MHKFHRKKYCITFHRLLCEYFYVIARQYDNLVITYY